MYKGKYTCIMYVQDACKYTGNLESLKKRKIVFGDKNEGKFLWKMYT